MLVHNSYQQFFTDNVELHQYNRYNTTKYNINHDKITQKILTDNNKPTA